MKTILVATDFSEAARSALLYATALARDFNAGIVLFSAYQMVPGPIADSMTIVSPAEMKELTQRQLDTEILATDISNTLSIKTCYEESMPVDGILDTAKDEQADLIVVAGNGSA